jgi:hypothetical protein
VAESRDETEYHDIVQMAHRFYREGRNHSSEWRAKAPAWYDLVANRQWDEDDAAQMSADMRIPVVVNRVARTVNAILGTQVNNRQETRYISREPGDVQVNEVLTGAADWVRDGADAEDEETDAFEDTIICGMGWTETRLDYENDLDGQIKIDRIDPLEMYWDANARKRNLSDARWMMRLKKVPMAVFREKWPNSEGGASDVWDDVRDDDSGVREHVYPNDAYKVEQAGSGRGRISRTVRVGQVQWVEHQDMYRVGRSAELLTAKTFGKLKPRLDAEGVPYTKQRGVHWKQAFIAGGELLEEGDCPFPNGPTFRPITYKRDRNRGTWYGIVDAMMDPQKYGNKFLSLIMDIITKSSKGGVIMEKDAVDDPKEVENKWSRPDALVFVRPGGIGKIKDKPQINLPPGLDRLVAYFLDSVHEVTGVNLELLGMANREQAGVLESTRKQAGITIIAPLFDGLRRYRKEQGRVLLYFIKTYITDGRLVRIVGKEGEQYVPLIHEEGVAQYDTIVDESPTSPNMKERVFGALSQLLPVLAKIGIPIPPDLLDYSPLPSALVAKWKEFIQQSGGSPEQKAQQMQKMQEQVQKLGQENAALKDKRQESAMDLQIKQQEMQVKAEIQRAELQLSIEKAKAEIAIEREKLALEREKIYGQAQLAKEKADQDMALNREKMEGDLDVEAKKAAGGVDEAIARHSKSLEYLFADHKKRFKIERDANGDITGAVAEGPNWRKRLKIVRGADGTIEGAESEDDAA